MEDLLKQLKESGSAKYVLMGPKGTGKTTTLFWFYHQLKKL